MSETYYRDDKLSQLQTELEQEREVNEMLQDSVCDLRSTFADLEERINSVDGEENEWRTRYETQLELNGQLETQISVVSERLERLRGDPADRLASIRSYDEMPVDDLRQKLNLLITEKNSLQTHLLDLQIRIVQEGKAYQKVYEERRAYLAEITQLSSTLDHNRRQQMVQARRTAQSQGKNRAQESLKQGSDKVMGSVRRTAALSRLPRLKR
ncbi:coiled-coil domain containing 169 [Triplophysa rosa]|uniref:coiled-coil domain containing 169 n=1 Tax=Triplophysa rosa TaxID=992332 RepID=UPI002545E9A1|nr:coiled-coil domain containing 169 [Triplophysa rosa]